VEEALAEISAAVRTGDYETLNTRYRKNGFVGIDAARQEGVRGVINRVIEALKRALGLGDSVSNAEVMQLIEDAWSQVRDSGTMRGQGGSDASQRSSEARAVRQPGRVRGSDGEVAVDGRAQPR
ncbi:hypothetical protein RZS08_51475, partial [Arthrospira platensis SPKY1]|nr:hypothetical protein [Arthrospira platensis SPKY1]